MIAYLSIFLLFGAWLGAYSTTIQGFLITLSLFAIFGIGGCIWMLKNIKIQKSNKAQQNGRNESK